MFDTDGSTTYIAKFNTFNEMNERLIVCRVELDFRVKMYSNKIKFKINGSEIGKKKTDINSYIKNSFFIFFLFLADVPSGSTVSFQTIVHLSLVVSFFFL